MGLFNSGIEEPKSKKLRYVVSSVALAAMLAGALWWTLRFTSEKHTVEHFMDALLGGDTQQAYHIWHPHPDFTYQDFLGFWGPNGYYSPIKSYHIRDLGMPPKGGSGVIVIIELSADAPFPSPDDKIKTAQTREVQLWVERSDQSLGFPPP